MAIIRENSAVFFMFEKFMIPTHFVTDIIIYNILFIIFQQFLFIIIVDKVNWGDRLKKNDFHINYLLSF